MKAALVGMKPQDGNMAPLGFPIRSQAMYVKIRAKDLQYPNQITQQKEAMTKGALYQNTGKCTLTGYLPSELAYQSQDIKLVTYVNNAECKKMVKKTRVKLIRNMVVKGHTIEG